MKNIIPIIVLVNGNYSEIETKKESTFISNEDNQYHIVSVKGKRLKIMRSNDQLFTASKSLQNTNGNFLGNTSEVEKGFIPSSHANNYYKNKIYKKREHAENFLKQQYFEKLRKICFGYLAQQEFLYSINYIENLNTIEVANLLSESWEGRGRFEMFLKIAKKYKKANVFKYQNQGGYVSQTENVY